MSGGHFDYNQYRIEDIAVEIDRVVDRDGSYYTPEIIARFRAASKQLRIAALMAHRIDWLLSGDDGPETFIKRWDTQIPKLEREIDQKMREAMK